jgi:tungstate transport system substrate-binding protein
MYKRVFMLIFLMGIVLAGCQPVQAPAAAPAAEAPAGDATRLVLATTTSTQDSGLLDVIVPDFEAEVGVDVDVIAVGTGQSLQLGADCNADVVLVHARAREDEFMEAGNGARREDVMFNDFVILGPAEDPAGIQGMTDAAAAVTAIAESGSTFISRGDDSGTHTKEKSVWAKAAIEPAGDWYVSAGQGMGAVLTMANEQQAYTLSDRATYLARTLEGTDLVLLVEGDATLFNPYGIITVNPEKCPSVNQAAGEQFVEWIISVPTQEKIAAFGMDEFGQSLFMPDSEPWNNK